MARAFPLGLILVVAQFWFAAQSGGRESAIGFVLIGLLAAVFAWSYVRQMTTVVNVSSRELSVQSLVSPQHVYARSAIRGVALRKVSSYMSVRSLAVIYGEGGRAVATLPEAFWDKDAITHLQAALGSHDTSYREVSRDQFRTEFPGAINTYLGWFLAAFVLAGIFVIALSQSR